MCKNNCPAHNLVIIGFVFLPERIFFCVMLTLQNFWLTFFRRKILQPQRGPEWSHTRALLWMSLIQLSITTEIILVCESRLSISLYQAIPTLLCLNSQLLPQTPLTTSNMILALNDGRK